MALAGVLLSAGGCNDPVMVDPPDDCSTLSQNGYVLEVMQHSYLWNEEVPDDVDPALYEEPRDILADLRYSEIDRWSRVSDKVTSNALFEEGKTISYGFSHMRDAAGKIRISFVHDDSPASRAGLIRGDEIIMINRLSISEIDAGGLWGDMFGPRELGVTVDLQVVEDEGVTRDVELTRDWIKIVTVPITNIVERDGRKIGYLYFTSFVDTAIPELDEAIAGFKQAGVDELVVDLRYNGGGRLKVARHLASLIAGDAGHDRELAYHVQYNYDLREENEEYKLDRLAHALTLNRVYFITTRRTLSASEVVINSVRPYVDTYVIGGVTGGKPVGMRSFEFCDKILYPITFRLVNADGETDYYDGLPSDCEANDDLLSQLGDPGEASFAAVLDLIDGKGCTVGDPMAGAPAPNPDEVPFLVDPIHATIGAW
jgi:C-terminal processing protease CtpA/Prc